MNKLKLTSSPFLVNDQMDYLIANGFGMEILNMNATVFTRGGIQVIVINDILIVKRWQDGEDDRTADYYEENRFNHFSALDELQFMFLLDAFDVIRIKDFVKLASQSDRAKVVELLTDALIPVT